MNNGNNNNSSLPFAIIGLVLLAALAGGFWFYQNSKSQAGKPKTNTNTNKKTDDAAELQLYASAPQGAQPPHFLGSPNATVTVEEFADFQCPTCGLQHPKMKEINALYGNRIKFIFRNFPLSQVHPKAYDAAVAAEAAGLQGKYWAMQDQLFGNQLAWVNASDSRKVFDEYAQKLGLDVLKFQNDMLGIAAKGRVDSDMERGRALKINGTPTIYINGKRIPFEQSEVASLKQIIDAELQKATTQTQTNQPTNQNTADNSAENK